MTDTISDIALEDTGGERRARRAAARPLDHTDGDIMDTPQYLPSNLPTQGAVPVQQSAPAPQPLQQPIQQQPVQPPVHAQTPQAPPPLQYQPPAMEYQAEAPRPAVHAAPPVQAAPIQQAPPVQQAQPPYGTQPTQATYGAPPAAVQYAERPSQQAPAQYQQEVAPAQHQPLTAPAQYEQHAAPTHFQAEQTHFQAEQTHYQNEPTHYQNEPVGGYQQQESPQQRTAAPEYQQSTERVLASRMEFTPLPSPVSFEPQPQQGGFQSLGSDELFLPRGGQSAPKPAVTVAPSEFDMQRDPSLNADRELDAALSQVVALGASDLHIAVNAPPMIRIDGGLRPLPDAGKWNAAKVTAALESILTPPQLSKFRDALEFDFAYTLSGTARFRVNFYQQRDNVGAAFRLIPTEIKSLQQLGVPESIAKFAQLARGLVLVTGPTGSGKSTTLAGLIDLVNRTRADHIMTVEDPIEFLHENKKSLINQREVGHDTHSFGAALKHVLRQDPDVILVGELRDLETISVALTAAETGHLVFATLHTSDAPQTIDRIIDVYPPHQQSQVRAQLAATLQGVVCQTLIKKASGKGRVVATEVLVRTNAVANLIREGKTFQIHSAMQAGRELGMHTIDQHLADLVSTGQISMESAREKAHDLDVLERLSSGARASSTGGNMTDDMSYGGQS